MSYDLFRKLYETYAAGVAYIAIRTPDGDERIGSAFHVGDGVFITAKHVVEGKKIVEIATTQNAMEEVEQREGVRIMRITHHRGKGEIVKGPLYLSDENADVAALIVKGINAPVIPVGDHLDDGIGTELVLRPVMVMGYPPIPFSREPTLVATMAEVNAIIDKYTGGHPHFILSTMARGGFSGGLAITDYGCALGVITESLGINGQPIELGYLSVLSVEPIYNCLSQHKIIPKTIFEMWGYDEEYTTGLNNEIQKSEK